MVSCNLDILFQHKTSRKHKIITISLLVLLPFATPLTFNFSSFTLNGGGLEYDQSAHIANNSLQLVRDLSTQASVGRATYNQSLHLWDRASGNIADFTTNFSFAINSSGQSPYADGFAFFLAPSGSRILNNAAGGMMGLTDVALAWNSTTNPFVAVEFDIHNNVWDPLTDDHVGIDVSSMSSVANVTWSTGDSILEGREHGAWISYDSKSMNLSVVFTSYRNQTSSIMQRLSTTVDFRDHLPEFVSVGFSAATGDFFASHTINSWSLDSNLVLATTESTPNNNVSPHPGSKSVIKLVIGMAVGVTVSVLISGLLIYFSCTMRQKRLMDEVVAAIGNDFERGSGPKHFAYKDLKKATNNFARQGKLGEGGFGGVYKGYLKGIDSDIAVKRVSKGSKQGIKEYASEVMIIGKLRHRNLVQLLGWCHEKKDELLLVYEFMPNGSLDSHLFNGKSLLDWSTRFKISQGLASALLYLHEEWERYVVHRDIKSSNIMLDSSFNSKLGDFGLARMVDHEKGCQTTALAGTWGYMAPEYVITRKASKETDVFSFGIVLLEIATGRKVTNPELEEDEDNLVEWVWRLHGNDKLLDAADPQLGSDFNSRELEQLLLVGLWCAHPYKTLRPSIKEVVLALRPEAPLPVLPSRMLVLPSCPPPVNELSYSYDITVVSVR